MRLLVCGGAGFIGSAFVRRVLAKHEDWEIVCFDKLTYAGNLENLLPVAEDPRYSFVRGDIGDRPAVDTAIESAGGVDAIVNFAAETHVDRSIAEPEAFLHTDILGTHTLLEAVREHEIGRMVQVSTDEVYGSIDEGSFSETDRIHPSSPYSASKAGGDLQVLAYHTTFGTPAFVTNALEGGQLPLYGDGLNVRDWLHVDDHADGIEAALLHGGPGEVYNIGGGNERTNLEITQIILDELGLDFEARVKRVADRPGHDRRYSITREKARKDLGWQPSVDFETGLRDTIRWYRDSPDWWGKLKHHEDFAEWRKRWYDDRN
jgi:dTDP-glucose 4,6-dehydratase